MEKVSDGCADFYRETEKLRCGGGEDVIAINRECEGEGWRKSVVIGLLGLLFRVRWKKKM